VRRDCRGHRRGAAAASCRAGLGPARGRTTAIALSTDNYRFTPEGVDDGGLAIAGMQPRRKDRSLIAGLMFVTSEGSLARIEGRLAKSPSFWVTRVNVIRSYRRINGVVMPVSLVETTANLRLLGSSALRMTYHYAQVDERAAIDDSSPD
jgi:hypothetical protein